MDGVRGVAILLVLVHHFVVYSGLIPSGGIDLAVYLLGAGAWIGVDVFFVLSGFLITGILYDSRSSPVFFRTFYIRRILRIFPLYYGVLAVVFLAPRLIGTPLLGMTPSGQFWYWAYLSNVDVARNGWHEPLQIAHFWSLAVEEQFYVMWPVVVFAFGRRRLLQIAGTALGAALLLRLVAPLWLGPLSAYTLMPMRMDALAAGACVALLARGPASWDVFGRWPGRALVAATVGLAAICVWRRGFGALDPVVRTVGYSLNAIGAASLIPIAMRASPESPLRRVLASSALVTLGKYSYGLYVFHHIVVLTLRARGFQVWRFPLLWGSHLPGWLAFTVVAMAISSALAWLSWHLWETPFLKLKRYVPYRSTAI
jgi:peptidoglycan/LPS O-acetylase OafA/YrhL